MINISGVNEYDQTRPKQNDGQGHQRQILINDKEPNGNLKLKQNQGHPNPIEILQTEAPKKKICVKITCFMK